MALKKIDSHQHFWAYGPARHSWINDDMKVLRRDFLPHHLAPLMPEREIAGSVLVQVRQSEEETSYFLELAGKHDFIKGIVGWVDLCGEAVDERLRHFKKNDFFKGVRHIVQSEPKGFLNEESFNKGIDRLKESGLTYDLLVHDSQLNESFDFVRRHPGLKVVLDHIGKPPIRDNRIDDWKRGIKTLAACQNLHCKVSGIVTEANHHNWTKAQLVPYLDVVFDAFGTDRLMFGSDWPVCELASNYVEVYDIVYEYTSSFPENEKEGVFGGNAVGFYNLKM